MSDNVEELNTKANKSSLLDQVKADIQKSATESVKAQLKKLVSERLEHERSINQLDVQIQDLLDKHKKGVL